MGELYRSQLWDFTKLGQLGMAAIYARLQSVGRGDTPQVICLNPESSGKRGRKRGIILRRLAVASRSVKL